MLEVLENERAELQKRFDEAMKQLQYFNTLVMQLEGAILSCDEIIKKVKENGSGKTN